MARTWLSAVVLAALFLRDLRLLTSAGSGKIVAACSTYPIFFGLYTVMLALWLSATHIRRPDQITMNEMAWSGVMVVHVVLCGLTWLISRLGLANKAWLLALAPSPATLLCLCLLAGALPANMLNSLGMFSLVLFSVIWNALILPFAFELVQGPSQDRYVPNLSLRFAALLNLSCFFCLFDGQGLSPDLSQSLGGALP